MQHYMAEWSKFSPMKRVGQPCEMAPCYVFLASEDSSFFSGQMFIMINQTFSPVLTCGSYTYPFRTNAVPYWRNPLRYAEGMQISMVLSLVKLYEVKWDVLPDIRVKMNIFENARV
eukprot:1151602-Pelagomonas_calceolata.AAC.2